jgi:hypothetical protein
MQMEEKLSAFTSNVDGGKVKKEHTTRPFSRHKRIDAPLLFNLLNGGCIPRGYSVHRFRKSVRRPSWALINDIGVSVLSIRATCFPNAGHQPGEREHSSEIISLAAFRKYPSDLLIPIYTVT